MQHPYERIEQAIRFLRAHAREQPPLAVVAAHAGLSPFHFQRLFRQWTGITPKRYLATLTASHAKRLLSGTGSILETAHDVGLSGPSRLHDLFVTLEAASPGEYRERGAGLTIQYGFHHSPFGPVLLAQTARGVCMLSFTGKNGAATELARLARIYARAELRQAQPETAATAQRIFSGDTSQPLQLSVRGTNLQVQVWRALLRIPPGAVRSYGELAVDLGKPNAARAVANAIAANPVNILIPCHRVLRGDGAVGGFRGGTESKIRLLASER